MFYLKSSQNHFEFLSISHGGDDQKMNNSVSKNRQYILQISFQITESNIFFTIARKEILTPNAYRYQDVGIDVSGMTSILFEVQACHDAHVLLMKTPADEAHDIIEIVIGKPMHVKKLPLILKHIHF